MTSARLQLGVSRRWRLKKFVLLRGKLLHSLTLRNSSRPPTLVKRYYLQMGEETWRSRKPVVVENTWDIWHKTKQLHLRKWRHFQVRSLLFPSPLQRSSFPPPVKRSVKSGIGLQSLGLIRGASLSLIPTCHGDLRVLEVWRPKVSLDYLPEMKIPKPGQ